MSKRKADDLLRNREGDGYVVLSEGKNQRRVTVAPFKGKVYVNLREFYQKSGDPSAWLPSKKGINLLPDEWAATMSASGAATGHAGTGTSWSTDINSGSATPRRLTVDTFNSSVLVSIREYYEAVAGSGDFKPGKAGLSLPVDQWHRLIGGMDSLNRELKIRQMGGEAVQQGAPQGDSADAAADAPGKGTADDADGSGGGKRVRGAEGAMEETDDVSVGPPSRDLLSVDLGDNRKLTVFRWGQDLQVHIREFNEAGKAGKGIKLTPAQWAALAASAPQVDEALKSA